MISDRITREKEDQKEMKKERKIALPDCVVPSYC